MAETKQRLLFIDIVRGLAVLAMMEAHVSNATILNSLKKTVQFHNLDLFNGFVSACFIFIAGFAICLVIDKRLELFLDWRKSTLWLQIRRLLFIIGLGYWLHIPYWSFRRLLHMDDATRLSFLRCDVLMTIGISLLFCLLVALIVRKRTLIAIILGALCLFIVFWTPFLYDTDPRTYTSPVLGTYLTAHQNNLFPLFPSSAYTFAGYFVCWIFLELKKRGKEQILFSILLPLGLIMLVGALRLYSSPWSYHAYADPAKSSPRFFMMKLGAVFLTLAAVWWYERLWKPTKSYMNMVGQESLFVYCLHLMIVYGGFVTPHNFAVDIGNSLTFLPAFALAALLIFVMCLVGVGWHILKRDHPKTAKIVFYAAFAYWLIGFLVNR